MLQFKFLNIGHFSLWNSSVFTLSGVGVVNYMRGALGPVRNRKTGQKIMQNRKTEANFNQIRKPNIITTITTIPANKFKVKVLNGRYLSRAIVEIQPSCGGYIDLYLGLSRILIK